jgi:hypothetical protein
MNVRAGGRAGIVVAAAAGWAGFNSVLALTVHLVFSSTNEKLDRSNFIEGVSFCEFSVRFFVH